MRVWFPLKLYGAAAFRRCLDEKLDLAEWACEELKKIDGIELVAEPQLSITAFRVAGGNEMNKKVLERIIAGKKTFISSTTIDGFVTLRIALLCFRTHREDVEKTIEAVRSALKD